MTKPQVFPVIHVRNNDLAIANAYKAFDAGCPGLFLISMEGIDDELDILGRTLKARFPDKAIGVNYLTLSPFAALVRNLEAGLDMTWADKPGVNSRMTTIEATHIAEVLKTRPAHQFFGSVAFKYQLPEPRPEEAAVKAADLGMIATTSGEGTGIAADLEKIRRMHAALNGKPFAIASGITPDNVAQYVPYLTHILVATGISEDFYTFSSAKLAALMAAIDAACAVAA